MKKTVLKKLVRERHDSLETSLLYEDTMRPHRNAKKKSKNRITEETMSLEQAKREALRISKKEGVVQHVNTIKNGRYEVSDWYDSDTTVASYENGRQI